RDEARLHRHRHRADRPALVGGNRGRGNTSGVKQIYPASITGKSFAAGGSVLDHAYGKGEPYTLGVEEEYMLLDAETFDLVQHVDTVLAATTGHELASRINPAPIPSVPQLAAHPP